MVGESLVGVRNEVDREAAAIERPLKEDATAT